MSNAAHRFAAAEELPIPRDVRPGAGWTERMLEMADHIGAYETLLLVDRFGGMRIYIPADWTKGKVYEGKGSIRDVIGNRAAERLSDVYRREYFHVPTAKHALRVARRAAVIAAVRRGDISGYEAAKILGTSRTYFSYLLNESEEGTGEAEAPPRSARAATGQPDLFDDLDDGA